MPPTFVSVEEAALRVSLTDEPADASLYRYPTEHDKDYRGAGGTLDQLRAKLENHPEVCLFGLPKTGKTFHALLLGLGWQPRFAFYGRMSDLEPDEVFEQWQAMGGRVGFLRVRTHRSALWIIDDAQESSRKCRQLRAMFGSLRLQDLDHRLLFVGWSGSAELRELPSVTLSLSAECIRLALEACGLKSRVPEEAVLSRLAEDQMIGLSQILFACKENPDLLNQPHKLTEEYVRRWFKPLNQNSQLLAVQLARLGFLGVHYPHSDDVAPLLQNGIAVPSAPHSRTVRLRQDELLRALLQIHIDPRNLRESLFEPVRSFIEDNPTDAWQVMESLRDHRKREDLEKFINAELTRESGLHLVFWPVGRESLQKAIRNSKVPLVDRVRLLAIFAKCLHELSRKEGPAAVTNAYAKTRSLAKDIVAEKNDEIRDRLSENDPETLRALLTLRKLGCDKKYDKSITAILDSPTFRKQVNALSRRLPLDNFLREINEYRITISPDSSLALPSRRRALNIWPPLTKVAHRELSEAVSMLELISKEEISKAIIAYPDLCAAFVRDDIVRGDITSSRRIVSILSDLLSVTSPDEKQISRWHRRGDLEGFLYLSHLTGQPELSQVASLQKRIAEDVSDPTLVVPLCNTVSDWSEHDQMRRWIIEAVKSRVEVLEQEIISAHGRRDIWYLQELTCYLEALVCLRDSTAIKVSDFGLDWQLKLPFLQDDNTFWWILNVAVAFGAAKQTNRLFTDFLNLIRKKWNPDYPAGWHDMALAGVIAYEQHSSPPAFTLGDDTTGLAMRPDAVVCQLYAIVMSKTSTARDLWLEGAVSVINASDGQLWKDYRTLHAPKKQYLLGMAKQAQEQLSLQKISLELVAWAS